MQSVTLRIINPEAIPNVREAWARILANMYLSDKEYFHKEYERRKKEGTLNDIKYKENIIKQ